MNGCRAAGIVKPVKAVSTMAADTVEIMGELHLGGRRSSAAAPKIAFSQEGFSEASRRAFTLAG